MENLDWEKMNAHDKTHKSRHVYSGPAPKGQDCNLHFMVNCQICFEKKQQNSVLSMRCQPHAAEADQNTEPQCKQCLQPIWYGIHSSNLKESREVAKLEKKALDAFYQKKTDNLCTPGGNQRFKS